MTTFIRKRLHWADSFDMFRKRMQEFLDLGTRAHEKLREAVVLDRVRNWKDYFGFMALQMKGHTGPTAPRVFQFVRRSGRTLSRHSFKLCQNISGGKGLCNRPLCRPAGYASASKIRISHGCGVEVRICCQQTTDSCQASGKVSDVPRCRCKQYMCDPHFYQSLDFLTAAHLEKLPAALPTSHFCGMRNDRGLCLILV